MSFAPRVLGVPESWVSPAGLLAGGVWLAGDAGACVSACFWSEAETRGPTFSGDAGGCAVVGPFGELGRACVVVGPLFWRTLLGVAFLTALLVVRVRLDVTIPPPAGLGWALRAEGVDTAAP